MTLRENPTSAIVIDFEEFVQAQNRVRDSHLLDGVPDYSFSLDREMRRRLASVPALRELARLTVRSAEPYYQQLHSVGAVLVSPTQYPKIFEMGVNCARTLGIGVPRIFIVSVDEANAYTYAADDARPSIVINTRLIRGLTDDELMAIIGHECGHVHNLHSAYRTLAYVCATLAMNRTMSIATRVLGAPMMLMQAAGMLLTGGVSLLLRQWQRAAEITCDRAGAICVGSVRPMMTALAKLETGGEQELAGFDVDELVAQMKHVRQTPLKLQELFHSHPLIPKRIAALQLFEDSEVYRAWLPPVASGPPARSRAELDQQCRDFLRIVGNPAAV